MSSFADVEKLEYWFEFDWIFSISWLFAINVIDTVCLRDCMVSTDYIVDSFVTISNFSNTVKTNSFLIHFKTVENSITKFWGVSENHVPNFTWKCNNGVKEHGPLNSEEL